MNAQEKRQLFHLQFDRLVNDFIGNLSLQNRRTVLFTSAAPLEGTTMVAREFSKKLAYRSGKRVILIDDNKIDHLSKSNLEKMLIEKLSKEYDHIVVDASSLLGTPEIIQWFKLADAIYFVVEAARTRGQVIEKALDTIRKYPAPILGMILNKRRYPIPETFYKLFYQ
jgi:hypothetical protein